MPRELLGGRVARSRVVLTDHLAALSPTPARGRTRTLRQQLLALARLFGSALARRRTIYPHFA